MSNSLINNQLDVYLCEVELLAEAILNETATFNRLGKNPAYQDGLRKAGRLAICASIIAQRSGSTVSHAPLDTEDELERSIDQTSLIEYWARKNGYWFDSPSEVEKNLIKRGYVFYGFGGESRVFAGPEPIDDVVKITTVSRSFSPQRFLDRIVIQNALSPLATETVEAFTRVRTDDGYELGLVTHQPFITASRELSGEEICSFMEILGFDEDSESRNRFASFYNADIIASDLSSSNVLLTLEGDIVIIDGDFEFNIPGYGLGGTFIFGPNEIIP